MRLLICGSKPASFITSADVGNDSLKRGNAVESKNFTPHVRGIGKETADPLGIGCVDCAGVLDARDDRKADIAGN